MNLYDPVYLGLKIAKSMGDELLVFCPYHFDSNPSAEYNLEKGLFYCFGCHEAKTAKQLCEDLDGTLVVMSTIPDEYRKRSGDDLSWVDLLKNPPAFGSEYLKERKVSEVEILKYSIHASSDGIIFPLKDRIGQIRGVQIRHFVKKPKYKFYGQRTPLWPMEELLHESYSKRAKGKVFITEGIFGALRLWELPKHNLSVAIMGSSSIDKAVRILKSAGNRKSYAVMDRDFAGQVAAGKFVLHGIPAVILPKDWNDSPDEFTVRECWEIIKNTEEYTTYDVNDIVENSSDPQKLQTTLEKYWRKI